MKKINTAILFSSLILSVYAVDPSNLICGKEIYGPVEGTAPSTLDDDDYYTNKKKPQKGNQDWTPKPKAGGSSNPKLKPKPKAGGSSDPKLKPKPKAGEPSDPKLLKPKSEKEVFAPEQ